MEHKYHLRSSRHQPPPLQQQSIVVNIDRMTDEELEKYDIFTPDDEYFTPPATTSTITILSAPCNKKEYQPRTLKSYNKARETILPRFPPRSTLLPKVQPSTTTTTMTTISLSSTNIINEEKIDLLLCNVPKQLLTLEQYQRRQMNIYTRPFELQTWDELKRKKYQSFMVLLHTNLYTQLRKEWRIDIPILDYNLARLYECAIKNNFQFSFNDLPLALEFFLQMDVDLFHLKTCSFRQSQRRIIIDANGQQSYEGIFAYDKKSIEGRYGLTACRQNNCLCCTNKTVQFNPKQIHCFLNQYKAILNCPVTCTTSNIIYALTCPCGKKDYVAHTNLPFTDCLEYHRQEIVRCIHEFLIGDANVNLIELTAKSEETKRNDENWLYQHATHCPAIIQLFLNRNPLYWCFVPLPIDRILRGNTYDPSPPFPTTEQIITTAAHLPIVRRSDTLAMRLANNIPKPTDGNYAFTLEQINHEKLFFKYGRDRDPINVDNLQFYNTTIVAVLPDHCSTTVKKFIESLFITHGECQLNKDGRLINQRFSSDYLDRGHWYFGLIHRPTPFFMS